MATQHSKKGSEKVLGRVLGKSSQKGFEKGACYHIHIIIFRTNSSETLHYLGTF